MFLSPKEILFFVLAFVVLFCTGKGVQISYTKLSPLALLVLSLSGAVLLLLVYKFGNIARCQADNFYFQVTPAKMCQGFPYMQTSDPELYNFCSKMLSTPNGVNAYDMVNCSTPGFVGRPVHFQYTPESDANWSNQRCNPPHLGLDDPTVL
jgi:hypothetical protein